MGGPATRTMFSAILTGLVLIVGCSEVKERDPTCYSVTGKVTYKGKPAHYAIVYFIPKDSTDERLAADGVCDEDGVFRLQTKKRTDGAEPGDYLVTISWKIPENPGSDDPGYSKELLPKKYQDPATSGLKFSVEATENEVPPFDLNP